MYFDWDESKNRINRDKHGVSFEDTQEAFFDPQRLDRADTLHSEVEPRFFCYGIASDWILTIRFTLRNGAIWIFGAAYWQKGAIEYENR
ncbi:MAG: BrnT family toxin [Spirochaetota bacterium]